jgi:hypothetical protein
MLLELPLPLAGRHWPHQLGNRVERRATELTFPRGTAPAQFSITPLRLAAVNGLDEIPKNCGQQPPTVGCQLPTNLRRNSTPSR